MADADSLVDTLKKLLKMQGLTYGEIAQRVELSEASVKRLFSQRTFTLARLEQFCGLLDIDFFELARVALGRKTDVQEMTLKQEESLAADERLLAVFYLAFNGWQMPDILANYEIAKADCIRLLVKLDRLDLVELLPENRLRLKVARTTRTRVDGPIRRIHARRVIGDFLAPQFEGGFFTLELRELSRASLEVLKRKLERLAAEFHDLAELDSHMRSKSRQTVGMALAIRPWTMPLLTGLTPRKTPLRNPHANRGNYSVET